MAMHAVVSVWRQLTARCTGWVHMDMHPLPVGPLLIVQMFTELRSLKKWYLELKSGDKFEEVSPRTRVIHG